jgi:hypothetical protein
LRVAGHRKGSNAVALGQFRAELFVEGVRSYWHGDAAAGSREYVDWVVDVSYLRRDEDAERLREGLRLAGLPA